MTSVYMKREIMKAQAALSLTHFPNCFLCIAPRSVPKFMKRMKVPDYKEKSVFGVPLIVHVQRCGFPLPLCLQQALSHLRTHCLDQVRKNAFHKDWISVCASSLHSANVGYLHFKYAAADIKLMVVFVSFPSLPTGFAFVVLLSGGTVSQVWREVSYSGFKAAV